MNYIRDWLIPDLRNLESLRASLRHMAEEFETLKIEAESIKAVSYDRDTVTGGENHQEDRLLTNIAKRQELEKSLEATRRHVRMMDELLSELPERDRLILDRMYIHGERAESIARDLGYEVRQIYRLKDAALRELGRRRFGIRE